MTFSYKLDNIRIMDSRNSILIFGKGFLGSRLAKEFNCPVADNKIFVYSDAEAEVLRHRPKIIINCIGATGKTNVDECESEKSKVLLANTFVPLYLSEIAFRHKIKLVHISSGCIFHYDYNKDRPIKEEKEPDYFSLFYSRSKIYAEKAILPLVKQKQANILILRVRIPLDDKPHPKNILDKLVSFRRPEYQNKVIDVPNSITYFPDFIKALKHLIKIDACGIYNAVNKGGLRYSKMLDVYRKYVPDFEYQIIPASKLKLDRTNLILSTTKLEKSGFKVRKIDSVLEECVSNYLKNKKKIS